MGAAIDKFMKRFEEFKSFPAGKPFSIRVTDKEATDAVQEYVTENKEWIKQQLKTATKLSLSVENPSINFLLDKLSISAKIGKGVLKANASLTADVLWKGQPNVNVSSVSVPFVSISPEKLNTIVKDPIDKFMGKVREYAEIRSLKLTDGAAVLEAIRKS